MVFGSVSIIFCVWLVLLLSPSVCNQCLKDDPRKEFSPILSKSHFVWLLVSSPFSIYIEKWFRKLQPAVFHYEQFTHVVDASATVLCLQCAFTQPDKKWIEMDCTVYVLSWYTTKTLLLVTSLQTVVNLRRYLLAACCKACPKGNKKGALYQMHLLTARRESWTTPGNRLVWLTFVFQQAPNFSVQLKLFVCSPWGGTLVLGWLAIRARSGRMLGAIVVGISSGRDCIDHLRRWFAAGDDGKYFSWCGVDLQWKITLLAGNTTSFQKY